MPEPIRKDIVLKGPNNNFQAHEVLNTTSETIFECVKYKNEYIQFKVRAWRTGLDIGLFTTDDNPQENQPTYTIKVGHQPWTESSVALDKTGLPPNLTIISTPHVLTIKEWKGFWIWTANGTISFGKENEYEPIISWRDRDFKPIEKIGFRVHAYPFIALEDREYEYQETNDDVVVRENKADIIIDTQRNSHDGSVISKPFGARWVKCALGQIPENAVVGGHDDSGRPMYVIRSTILHALTPGKLIHGKVGCEVAWGGRENTLEAYEVLTDFDGEWVKSSGDKIPPHALLAGRSEDNFPLYVGRTEYLGTLTLGKVQPNHKALYIPYDGQEKAFPNYEILCHKPPGPPVIPHPPILLSYEDKQPALRWVYSCNGRAPRNAFIAGHFLGNPVILIRAEFQGTWYPGWMQCKESTGHIIAKFCCEEVEEFEVLCDFKGYWEKPIDSNLPANALVLGKDDEQRMHIYVGRAEHLGNLLCGSVDKEMMKCKIPFEQVDVWKDSFEVLCYPNPVESITKKGLQYVRKWDL